MGPSTYIRPTWAEVNVSAFRHNLKSLRQFLPKRVQIMAVLKADGYGHGALPLALAAEQEKAWGIGVSSVEEGMALRAGGVHAKILVLGTLYPFESFDDVLAHNLIPTVASRFSAQALVQRAKAQGRPAPCHVKIDTGMGRIGMTAASAKTLLPELAAHPWLRLDGVYTHLACPEAPAATSEQLKRFEDAVAPIRAWERRPLFHVANSGGTLAAPRSRFDLVRPGLALFGIAPWPALGRRIKLRPALAWKTRVVFVKMVPKGTPVSYGWTWRAKRRSRLATLPVGYADGFRRDLSPQAKVLIKGRRCQVVGRVTMDQILVDVTGIPGVDVGEEAVLIGRQGTERITAEELAGWADTIPYEVLCGISKRVPRIYDVTSGF